MSGRLPLELYGKIMQYMQDRHDLFPLLTVSHLLCYEVERVLYRTLEIRMSDRPGSPEDSIHVTQFPHYKRVGHHARSALLHGICYDTADAFIPILLSLTNIKALTLQFANTYQPSSFPEQVPFHLLELTIRGHKGDYALVSFVQSQTSLRKLSWMNADHKKISLSRSDLPHLTTLSSSNPSFIYSILLGRKVKVLFCLNSALSRDLGLAPFPSVQALFVASHNDLNGIARLFPNLQYLLICYDEALFLHLSLFKQLNRLTVVALAACSLPEVASRLFVCNEHITVVELAPTAPGILSRFGRGFEKDETLVSSVKALDTYGELFHSYPSC